MNLDLRNKVVNTIKHNENLFEKFKNIYLFGSILSIDKLPDDIDILLIYTCKTNMVIEDVKFIKYFLEEKVDLDIHLTVLSKNEESEVGFLKKLNSSFFQIK